MPVSSQNYTTGLRRLLALSAHVFIALTWPLPAPAIACVLKAQPAKAYRLSRVLVSAGRMSFHVNVTNLTDVELRLPRWPGDYYRVRVLGPVAFDGALKYTSLTVVRPVRSIERMVTLIPGVEIANAYASNEIVTVTLERSGCPKHPPDEILRAPRISCESLSFAYEDAPREWPSQDDDLEDAEEQETWGTLENDVRKLQFFASPSWRSYSITLSWSPAGGGGPLRVLEQRGAWLQVRHRWPSGAIIKGWIPRRLLYLEQVEGTLGAGSAFPICEFGYFVSITEPPRRSELSDGVQPAVRLARVRAGARVSNEHGTWGTVTREATFEVEDSGGSRIKLVSVPGLSGNEVQAWVHRDQVTFMAEDD